MEPKDVKENKTPICGKDLDFGPAFSSAVGEVAGQLRLHA